MSKQSPSLDIVTSMTFNQKVPLAVRKEIVERVAGAVSELFLTGPDLPNGTHLGDLVELGTVECTATSQEIEVPIP